MSNEPISMALQTQTWACFQSNWIRRFSLLYPLEIASARCWRVSHYYRIEQDPIKMSMDSVTNIFNQFSLNKRTVTPSKLVFLRASRKIFSQSFTRYSNLLIKCSFRLATYWIANAAAQIPSYVCRSFFIAC